MAEGSDLQAKSLCKATHLRFENDEDTARARSNVPKTLLLFLICEVALGESRGDLAIALFGFCLCGEAAVHSSPYEECTMHGQLEVHR